MVWWLPYLIVEVVAVLVGCMLRLVLEILGLIIPDSLDEGGVALGLGRGVMVVHCI